MLGQIGRAAMVPWWTAQLLTGAKSFERNRVIGNRRLNEKGLHVARVSLAHRMAAARRDRLAHLISLADRADFARDGFVIRRNFLAAEEFAMPAPEVSANRGRGPPVLESFNSLGLGRENRGRGVPPVAGGDDIFRVEVRGLENLPPAGTRIVIAPNHVSLIDGPLLHAILPIEASFAVDTGIAKAWWAKPFLKMIRHYTIDPTKPL